jgi:pimeloyl-ACP methyl ester carboxylesterase
MKTIEHFIPNEDGWRLSLFQSWDASRLDRGRNPVLIVPGYGMNSFIFSYHPSGLSLESYLVEAGYEVWRADLRAQGASVSIGGGHDFHLEDLALTDLGVAIRAALSRSHTRADRVDVIGASLGGTIMFIHAALNPDHRIGSLVAMGTPVRWVEIHPVLKLACRSPSLIGMVRLRGTRRLAGIALPRLMRFVPSMLSVYMNASITDVRAAGEMVKTVEDPNQSINRQIAHWIRDRDLTIRDSNLSTAIRSIKNPLLCVIAKDDGIVPRRTAEYPYLTVASPVRRLLEVATPDSAVAHADLFVSNVAQERVFAPIAGWLASAGVLVAGRR